MKLYSNPLILYRTSRVGTNYLNCMNFEEIYNEYTELKDENLLIESKIPPVIQKIEETFLESKNNKLLNVKRDLFNKCYHRVEKSLKNISDYKVSKDISDIIKAHKELEKKFELNKSKYDEWNLVSRRVLKKAFLKEKDLTDSLIHFNESIYNKLFKYLDSPVENHKNNLRKLDYMFLKILSRATMKTSPFSTLTLVARAAKNGVDEVDKLHKNVYLNNAIMLRSFFKGIFNSNESLKNIELKRGNLRVENGFVHIVGQRDNHMSTKVFGNQDFFSKIALNKFLKIFLDKYKDTRFKYDDFADILEDLKLPEEEILKLLRKYLELGLIVPCIGVKEDGDFLASLKEAYKIYYCEGDNLKHILQILDNLHIKLVDFRDSDYTKRHHVFSDIKKLLKELSVVTGSEIDTEKCIIYEDAYSTDIKKISINNEVMEQLSNLQKFYILFDPNIRMILEVSERLKDIKEPTMIDYKIVTHFFETSKKVMPYWGNPNYKSTECKSLDLKILDDLKERFITDLNELYMQDGEEINIEKLVMSTIDQIPKRILKDMEISTTFFMQSISDSEFVINSSYDGFSKFKSRFFEYFKDFTEKDAQYKNYIEKVFEENNYLEILDFFGFNGGVHSKVLNKSCSLNLGTERFLYRDDKENRVGFDSLKVYYDDNVKRLRFINEEGENVKFCYMSSLVSLMLPGYLSFIIGMNSIGRMGVSISDLIETNIKPRVRFENLIVSRKRWGLNIVKDIFNDDKMDDYSYYIHINDAINKNKIPTEFYLKYKKDYANMDLKSDMTQFKPQYINLRNPLLVKLFRKIVNRNEINNYYIEEAKPRNFNRVEEYSLELTSLYGDEDE